MKGIFTFLDKNKKVIQEKGINKINYKEELIIKESIKLFNDNNPCIIHKTYSVNSIAINFLKEIEENLNEETIFNLSDIPDFIKDKIEIYGGTIFLKIK